VDTLSTISPVLFLYRKKSCPRVGGVTTKGNLMERKITPDAPKKTELP